MLQSLLDIGFHRLPWPGIAGFFEGLERETEYSLSGRAFLLNIRDRSCIPLFGLEGFPRVFPPKKDRNWVIDTPLGEETYEGATWRSEKWSVSAYNGF